MTYQQQPGPAGWETQGGYTPDPGGAPPQQQAGLPPWPGGAWPQPGYHGGVPPRRPRRTGLVIGIVAAALIGLGGGAALTLAFTSKDSGTGGSALPFSLAPSSSSAPSVDPDPFSAQAGDCIHGNPRGRTRGEFSSSAVRVSCSDATANYTVVAQLASGRGADCDSVPGWDSYSGGVVVDDFETGKERELCVMPRK